MTCYKERQPSHDVRGGLILLVTLPYLANVTAQVCVQPPAGLVSWWPAEEDADDIAGPYDGTLPNGVTFARGMVGRPSASTACI